MIVTTMNTEAESPTAQERAVYGGGPTMMCMAPIMEMKEDGSWDYILAESVDVNEDMTQYTVHLRSDAKWSNGDDVTSADFKNTIVRALDPNCKRVIPQCLPGLRELRKCTTEPAMRAVLA